MSKRALHKPPKLPYVQVTLTTWIKDTHGLFDYQANPQHLQKQIIYLQQQCRIYRNPEKNQTIVHKSQEARRIAHENIQVGTLLIDRSSSTPIYKLKTATKQRRNTQSNKNKNREEFDMHPFSVVKDFVCQKGINGFPLKPGNIIKLGRVQFMVIELRNNDQVISLRDTQHFEEVNGIFQPLENISENQQIYCKVCLCNQATQQNPLISPCNCKGTCSVIHVSCLQTWINSKVKRQIHGIAISYNFTKFECQICKAPFPKEIKIKKQNIQMMNITKPQKPYIMLESLFSKNQVKEQKCLHMITADESSVKIGRGHNCDIRVADISVSRNHAEIFFEKNNFYIKDLGSKFGSLVKFNDQYSINHENPFKIQLGRTLLEFKVIKQPIQVDTE